MSDNYSLEYKVIPNLLAQYTQKKIPLNMLAKTTFMQMIMMGKRFAGVKSRLTCMMSKSRQRLPTDAGSLHTHFLLLRKLPKPNGA